MCTIFRHSWNYLGMWWHAMFNINFCPYKLGNVCLFRCIYLPLFCFMNISYFFELLVCLIAIALTRHFKGHLKILASMLYYKSHYLEVYYQYSISNSIATAKISFFSYKIFLEKIEHLYQMHLNKLFNYLALISLWYNYSFL